MDTSSTEEIQEFLEESIKGKSKNSYIKLIVMVWVWSWRCMKSLQARVAVGCKYLKSLLK
jgi:hypothetical protein